MPFVLPLTTIIVVFVFGAILLNSQGKGGLQLRQFAATPSSNPNIQDVICDCKLRELCEADLTSLNIQYCGYEVGAEKVSRDMICCPIELHTIRNALLNNGSTMRNSSLPAEVSEDFQYLPDEAKTQSESLDFDYVDDSKRKTSPKSPKAEVLGENQVSHKAHENFKLLPTWKECGSSPLSGKNSDVTFDKYPWIAQIGYKTDTGEVQYRCLGTLITQNYLLTSAHCNQNGVPSEVLIKMPQGTANNKFARFEVANSWSHPAYNEETMENDIIIHRISTPVNKTLQFAPTCLPFTNEYGFQRADYMDNSKFIGFRTDAVNNAVSLTHDIEEFGVSILKCKSDTQSQLRSSNSEQKPICVDIRQKVKGGSCGGGEIDGSVYSQIRDEKALSKYILVGISSAPLNCLTNQQAKLTRVSEYLEWILDSIES